jgi:hypothetical protein
MSNPDSARNAGSFSAARPAARWRPRVVVAWGLVAVIAAAYLWFVRKNCAPYASNADASCYLNSARMMLDGKLSVPVPRIEGLAPPDWDYHYQLPLDFRLIGNEGRMASLGALGYPLHLMAAVPFVGLDWAVVMVNVIAAGAAVLLMVALGRRCGLPWAWALAGAALVWACPVFVYMVLQPMTDVTGMVWCMAAILAAWHARDRWPWAVAAGMAVAVAVLVRPANLMLMLPVGLALGLRWRAWLALIAGGLPGAVFLAGFNWKLYGAVLTTGYGDISDAFGLKYVAHNVVCFVTGVPVQLSPLPVLAALGLPWLWRRMPFAVALLAVWVAAFVGFYIFCYYSGLAWSIRYLMPTFPAILLAGLLVVRHLTAKLPRPALRAGVPLALLALALTWQVLAGKKLDVVIMKRGEIVYVQGAEWMRRHAPANAIVLANQVSGAFYYYTDFTLVRYDSTEPVHLQRLYAAAQAAGRPVYAAIFDPESEQAFKRHLRGKWEQLSRHGMVVIWKLTSPPPAEP